MNSNIKISQKLFCCNLFLVKVLRHYKVTRLTFPAIFVVIITLKIISFPRSFFHHKLNYNCSIITLENNNKKLYKKMFKIKLIF